MYDQLKDYFDKTLSKYQCGFRKGTTLLTCHDRKATKTSSQWGVFSCSFD